MKKFKLNNAFLSEPNVFIPDLDKFVDLIKKNNLTYTLSIAPFYKDVFVLCENRPEDNYTLGIHWIEVKSEENKTETTKLKPCRFCGSNPKIHNEPPYINNLISCSNLECYAYNHLVSQLDWQRERKPIVKPPAKKSAYEISEIVNKNVVKTQPLLSEQLLGEIEQQLKDLHAVNILELVALKKLKNIIGDYLNALDAEENLRTARQRRQLKELMK